MKLKPCPFCGGCALTRSIADGEEEWVVDCAECKCMLDDFYNTEELAIEAWNTRAREHCC